MIKSNYPSNSLSHLTDLMQGVFSDYSLCDLLRLCEKHLHRPCMVIDTGFRVIGMSPAVSLSAAQTPSSTVNYLGNVRGIPYLGEAYVEKLRSHYIFSRLYERKYICRSVDMDSVPAFLAASLQVQPSEVYLFLVFSETGAFSADDMRLVKQICQILSVPLRLNNPYSTFPVIGPNYLLIDLLDGNFIEKDRLNDRLSHLDWIADPPYSLMIIRSRGTEPSVRHFEPVISVLKQWIPLSACVLYQNSLVVFLSESIYQLLAIEQSAAFTDFLNSYSLYAAIGPSYQNLFDTHHNYELTQTVFLAGIHYHQTLTLFADMCDNLMAYLLEMHFGVRECLHPAIRKILEYDDINQMDLFDTLEIYLHYRDEIDQAAKLLHMQRSTLFYRIKKIKELTGLKLDKLDEIIQLHFSIHLVRLYGREFF